MTKIPPPQTGRPTVPRCAHLNASRCFPLAKISSLRLSQGFIRCRLLKYACFAFAAQNYWFICTYDGKQAHVPTRTDENSLMRALSVRAKQVHSSSSSDGGNSISRANWSWKIYSNLLIKEKQIAINSSSWRMVVAWRHCNASCTVHTKCTNCEMATVFEATFEGTLRSCRPTCMLLNQRALSGHLFQ